MGGTQGRVDRASVLVGTQWSRFLNVHPEQVRRGVHALIASGVAVEETVPHIRGIGRVCRIFSRRLYRALDAEDIRHHQIVSPRARVLISEATTDPQPGLRWSQPVDATSWQRQFKLPGGTRCADGGSTGG